MEILISGILGAIIWQSISLIAFAITDENEDVGLQMGMGLPLIFAQLAIAFTQKIKWKIFCKRYHLYFFKDTTLNDYEQICCGRYAKPLDMRCFNFDTNAKYHIIEKEMPRKYRHVQKSEILTAQEVEDGFSGMSKKYLNLFKINGI